MTLEEAKAAPEGTPVVYSPAGGDPEPGWITGTSATMVLVRYGTDKHAKATRPEDLSFMFASDLLLARRGASRGQ